jgi:hypothetical protein
MAATGGPSRIIGKTDLELEGMIRGPDAARAAGALQDARAGTRGGGTYGAARSQAIDPGGLEIAWDLLQQRNAEWLGPYWEECRALYAGGNRLLGDKKVFERLFPKNRFEPGDVYGARQARAHYYPYAGTIIDSLLSGLSSDPLRVAFGTIDDSTGQLEPATGADWWGDFIEDVTDEAADNDIDDDGDATDDDASGPAGGVSMHHFMIELLRECEQTRFAWVRCDLPPAPEVAPTSKLEEDEQNSPYLCIVPAEQVIDWECDDVTKDLLWVLTLEVTSPRESIRVKRGKKLHHVYTLWTQTDWARYEIDVDPSNLPNEAATFTPVAAATHDFGRVPFVRVMLPEGLWAMGKLHSLAREHFNKRCAMSWAEYKSLFSILYEFLDDGMAGQDMPVVGQDPNRATDQLRTQGYSQIRRANDKAMFVGPDPIAFKEARDSCNDAMREMHRVMFSMALSANMDKQALSRSGDSKEQDSITTQVVLAALGQLARRIVRALLALVSCVKKEPVPDTIVMGLEHFDVTGVSSAIADAVQVFSGLPISKSPTAYAIYLCNLLRKICGDSITDDQVATIREEIETRLAAEEELMQASQDALANGPTPSTDPNNPNGQDPDDKDDREPPAKISGGAVSSKPMGSGPKRR